MSNPEAYVREIKSICEEIKRSNTRLSTLREQRKYKQSLLYKYMVDRGLEKFEGITINSISPKAPKPRKPEVEKRKDAVELFRQAGISNPEDFYTEFKTTQIAHPRGNGDDESHSPKRKSSKKTKNEYDPFLGY